MINPLKVPILSLLLGGASSQRINSTKNKIGDSGLLIPYIEHSEKEREKYFKVPLKDAVKYKQLKQEDEEIVSDLLDVLTATNIYKLLEIFRRNTCS